MESWKDLGVQQNSSKEIILEKPSEMKNRKKGSRRLSESKRLLIELVVSCGEKDIGIEKSTLIALFNGILYQ
jgi:hypothetical protein